MVVSSRNDNAVDKIFDSYAKNSLVGFLKQVSLT